MASREWEECKSCQKRNNKLACLLHECKIREQKDKEMFRRWHQEWVKKKVCFGCEHCKCRWTYDHSYKTTEDYCELTGKVVFVEDTCEKWTEGEFEE